MFELYLLFYLETSSSVFFTAAPDCPTLWLTFGFSGNKSKLLFMFYFYLACSLLEKNRQAEISFQIKLRAKNFFYWVAPLIKAHKDRVFALGPGPAADVRNSARLLSIKGRHFSTIHQGLESLSSADGQCAPSHF